MFSDSNNPTIIADWIMMTILKPALLLQETAFGLIPTSAAASFKHASVQSFHKRRLYCSFCCHILQIYQAHGFYVNPSASVEAKNVQLYNWLRSKDLKRGKFKKLIRKTDSGFGVTNVPIVLALIATLMEKGVLTMEMKWVKYQTQSKLLLVKMKPEDGNGYLPYRKWYMPKFQFSGQGPKVFSLLDVFDLLVFGTLNTDIGQDRKFPPLKDSVHAKIAEIESKLSVDEFVKMIWPTDDKKGGKEKDKDERFLSTPELHGVNVKEIYPENTVKELEGLQNNLLCRATLVGINIEMILHANPNAGETEMAGIPSSQVFSQKYLKGGEEKIPSKDDSGKKKSVRIRFPIEAVDPIQKRLKSELNRMVGTVATMAFKENNVEYKDLWRSLNKMKTEEVSQRTTIQTAPTTPTRASATSQDDQVPGTPADQGIADLEKEAQIGTPVDAFAAAFPPEEEKGKGSKKPATSTPKGLTRSAKKANKLSQEHQGSDSDEHENEEDDDDDLSESTNRKSQPAASGTAARSGSPSRTTHPPVRLDPSPDRAKIAAEKTTTKTAATKRRSNSDPKKPAPKKQRR